MPEKKTIRRARRAKRQGKSASTQAGEFVREEMHHIRRGKHGARSTKQAIAIGLSKARRSGVKLKRKGRAKTRRTAASGRNTSPKRARAVRSALEREGRQAASPKALSRQTRQSARRRGPRSLKAAARKAARTKGPAVRKAAARKAAATRKAA